LSLVIAAAAPAQSVASTARDGFGKRSESRVPAQPESAVSVEAGIEAEVARGGGAEVDQPVLRHAVALVKFLLQCLIALAGRQEGPHATKSGALTFEVAATARVRPRERQSGAS
jgi:hypothetical protein